MAMINIKAENDILFGKLYQDNFDKISKFVQYNNGNQADAEDLFQDAMMVLLEKLRQNQFQLTASLNTYIYAICKNLWLKKLRHRKQELSLMEIRSLEFMNSIDDSVEHEKTYYEKLKSYLLKITDHCKRLIQDIFFKEKAIQQIQREYGYSTKHNAQNQKFKCIAQIRRLKELEEISKKVG